MRGCGSSPVIRPGHAVSETALAEDIFRVPGVVAELAAELADGVAHGLRVGADPVAPHPALEGLIGGRPAGVERERVRILGSMAVSCTGLPATFTRRDARSMASSPSTKSPGAA